MNNDAFVKNVASRLIEQIRNGTAPWQKPWRPGTSFLPFNPTNGTRYKGINVVNLSAVESKPASDGRIKTSHFFCLNRAGIFWQEVILHWGLIHRKASERSGSKSSCLAGAILAFDPLERGHERKGIKGKMQLPACVKRRRAQGRNGINGGSP
jgi:N-terminal domain of anti-restriction factor ArdC